MTAIGYEEFKDSVDEIYYNIAMYELTKKRMAPEGSAYFAGVMQESEKELIERMAHVPGTNYDPMHELHCGKFRIDHALQRLMPEELYDAVFKDRRGYTDECRCAAVAYLAVYHEAERRRDEDIARLKEDVIRFAKGNDTRPVEISAVRLRTVLGSDLPREDKEELIRFMTGKKEIRAKEGAEYEYQIGPDMYSSDDPWIVYYYAPENLEGVFKPGSREVARLILDEYENRRFAFGEHAMDEVRVSGVSNDYLRSVMGAVSYAGMTREETKDIKRQIISMMFDGTIRDDQIRQYYLQGPDGECIEYRGEEKDDVGWLSKDQEAVKSVFYALSSGEEGSSIAESIRSRAGEGASKYELFKAAFDVIAEDQETNAKQTKKLKDLDPNDRSEDRARKLRGDIGRSSSWLYKSLHHTQPSKLKGAFEYVAKLKHERETLLGNHIKIGDARRQLRKEVSWEFFVEKQETSMRYERAIKKAYNMLASAEDLEDPELRETVKNIYDEAERLYLYDEDGRYRPYTDHGTRTRAKEKECRSDTLYDICDTMGYSMSEEGIEEVHDSMFYYADSIGRYLASFEWHLYEPEEDVVFDRVPTLGSFIQADMRDLNRTAAYTLFETTHDHASAWWLKRLDDRCDRFLGALRNNVTAGYLDAEYEEGIVAQLRPLLEFNETAAQLRPLLEFKYPYPATGPEQASRDMLCEMAEGLISSGQYAIGGESARAEAASYMDSLYTEYWAREDPER